MERSVLNALAAGSADLESEIEAGRVRVEGEIPPALDLFGLLDTFDRWFPVVTP